MQTIKRLISTWESFVATYHQIHAAAYHKLDLCDYLELMVLAMAAGLAGLLVGLYFYF